MNELIYKQGRIYEITTKDITGDFDITAEIARLTKERDSIDAKIKELTSAKIDIASKKDEPIPGETITTK